MKAFLKHLLFYGTFFLLTLLPLIYFPDSYNSYEFPKFIAFIAVSQFLTFSLFLKTLLQKQGSVPIRFDKLTSLILIFALCAFFADLWGIDVKTSLLGSSFRHQGFVTLAGCIGFYFVIRHLAIDQKLVKKLIWGLLIGSTLVSFFALWQAVSIYIFKDPNIPTYQGRIVGTMGNPNSLAGYLVTVLPFFLWRRTSTQQRNRHKIILQGLSILLLFFTLWLTQSRSALVAAVVILALFIFRNHFVIIKKIAIIAITLTILTVLLQVSTNFLNFKESPSLTLEKQAKYCLFTVPDGPMRNFTFFLYQNFPNIIERTSFCEDRFAIWSAGTQAVIERPLLGIGQENFELIFPKERGLKVDNAHNIFLEVAVASGLVGLSVFVTILWTAFRKANTTVRLSLIAFLIVAQLNPLSIAQIMLFWFLLAISRRMKD